MRETHHAAARVFENHTHACTEDDSSTSDSSADVSSGDENEQCGGQMIASTPLSCLNSPRNAPGAPRRLSTKGFEGERSTKPAPPGGGMRRPCRPQLRSAAPFKTVDSKEENSINIGVGCKEGTLEVDGQFLPSVRNGRTAAPAKPMGGAQSFPKNQSF